jgi:hypothetical protein
MYVFKKSPPPTRGRKQSVMLHREKHEENYEKGTVRNGIWRQRNDMKNGS